MDQFGQIGKLGRSINPKNGAILEVTTTSLANAARKECEGHGVDHYYGDSFDYSYGYACDDFGYGEGSDPFEPTCSC